MYLLLFRHQHLSQLVSPFEFTLFTLHGYLFVIPPLPRLQHPLRYALRYYLKRSTAQRCHILKHDIAKFPCIPTHHHVPVFHSFALRDEPYFSASRIFFGTRDFLSRIPPLCASDHQYSPVFSPLNFTCPLLESDATYFPGTSSSSSPVKLTEPAIPVPLMFRAIFPHSASFLQSSARLSLGHDYLRFHPLPAPWFPLHHSTTT